MTCDRMTPLLLLVLLEGCIFSPTLAVHLPSLVIISAKICTSSWCPEDSDWCCE